MFIALTLAALLSQLPQNQGETVIPIRTLIETPKMESFGKPFVEVKVSTMTLEDLQRYPGRERFDKTEWYEAQLKSMQSIVVPEHVDEWDNGGLDIARLHPTSHREGA